MKTFAMGVCLGFAALFMLAARDYQAASPWLAGFWIIFAMADKR